MFAPLERYGCTNRLCRHEAILWKRSPLAQRPIVAVAALSGATLAGVLLAGAGLYLASDETTRARMRDAYARVVQHEPETPRDATLAIPGAAQPLEFKYESASGLDAYPRTGDLRPDVVPPLPPLPPVDETGQDRNGE